MLLFNSQKASKKGDSLKKSWKGPFEIISVKNNKNVELKGRKRLVSVQHLKPYTLVGEATCSYRPTFPVCKSYVQALK